MVFYFYFCVFFFFKGFFFVKRWELQIHFTAVFTQFLILQYWWKPQSKMLILLFLLFFFFLTLSTINRVFFFLLFQFLIPVYNVKLFLQLVIVIIFKYFFSSLKITKQDRKLKRWSLLLHILHLDFFILLPTVFYGGYYYRDADDDRYIHIQNKYILK